MALRGGKLARITNWLGLQTFASAVNIAFGWWTDSNNVVVTNDGSAAILRSPANFNNALVTSNPLKSAFDYGKQSGNLILFDSSASSSVATWSTTGTTNTLIRSAQADSTWTRITINDMAYGVNGGEFLQTNGTTVYAVGIASAAAAPTLSFVAGGSGSLASGVNVSYAYRNSTTRHVGAPSPASLASGASGSNLTLRIAVIGLTSTGTDVGVDGIVLFITQDGGSVRYLYTNSSGDPVINNNTTGNIDISLALLTNVDTLTPETSFNTAPPQNAFHMFRWGDRLCLCDFRGALTRQQVQYNVYENCYYGIPWESWYPLNIINIPSKNDAARSGIATQLGALILGEQDSYLINGSLTDKISGPEGSISITEHIQSLGWSIGTRSPKTLVTTPFGEIWLDQNKRIQIWTHEEFPVEAGLPIRTSLDAIQDTDAARNMAEAVWFQHGQNGGQYVLTASTTGSTNNKLFILTVYKDPESGEQRFACAVSDIAAQCLVVAQVSGKKRLFIGTTDRLREIFDLTTAGAGWSSTQTRSFSTIVGNADEYCYWSDLRFDASSILGLTVTVTDFDNGESQTVDLERDSSSSYRGRIDAYGDRKIITFTYSSDDTEKRVIQNLRVAYKPTGRLI